MTAYSSISNNYVAVHTREEKCLATCITDSTARILAKMIAGKSARYFVFNIVRWVVADFYLVEIVYQPRRNDSSRAVSLAVPTILLL